VDQGHRENVEIGWVVGALVEEVLTVEVEPDGCGGRLDP
jgi:hypothetical protein